MISCVANERLCYPDGFCPPEALGHANTCTADGQVLNDSCAEKPRNHRDRCNFRCGNARTILKVDIYTSSPVACSYLILRPV